MEPLFENELVKVLVEPFEIPWIKIFTQQNIKEFSQCDNLTKQEILRCVDVTERLMLEYFKPAKINIASFGNYLPHVHFHVQARFENDSFFPEPTWGVKQRQSNLDLPDFKLFYEALVLKLKEDKIAK
ncbi:MAG: HIT family protein [Campylobacterales bacterium]|nr:HIT family protein [Campylobacterales bacterium]